MKCHHAMLLVLCSLVFLAGCGGPPPVMVKGKITQDGKPVTVGPSGKIELIFEPEKDDAGRAYPAVVQADGTFEVVGRDNRGIVPGKYKVNVRVLDPYIPADPKVGDKLKNKNTRIFSDTGILKADNRIPVEITGATDNLEIKVK